MLRSWADRKCILRRECLRQQTALLSSCQCRMPWAQSYSAVDMPDKVNSDTGRSGRCSLQTCSLHIQPSVRPDALLALPPEQSGRRSMTKSWSAVQPAWGPHRLHCCLVFRDVARNLNLMWPMSLPTGLLSHVWVTAAYKPGVRFLNGEGRRWPGVQEVCNSKQQLQASLYIKSADILKHNQMNLFML